MIWTKALWQIHALTQTPNWNTFFPLTFYVQDKATNCPSIRWTPHCVVGLTAQQHRRRVIRKQKPVGQILWLDAAAVIKAWEKQPFKLRLLPARSTAVSLSSDCARCFKITGRLKNLRCLAVFLSQSFFCTFSVFVWIFWWTTFNVVRKFPRNRTRNVRASINTWKEKRCFYFKTSHNMHLITVALSAFRNVERLGHVE